MVQSSLFSSSSSIEIEIITKSKFMKPKKARPKKKVFDAEIYSASAVQLDFVADCYLKIRVTGPAAKLYSVSNSRFTWFNKATQKVVFGKQPKIARAQNAFEKLLTERIQFHKLQVPILPDKEVWCCYMLVSSLNHRSDTHNLPKGILDICQTAGVYSNDHYIRCFPIFGSDIEQDSLDLFLCFVPWRVARYWAQPMVESFL